LIETTYEANADNLLQEPDFIGWFGKKAGISVSSKTYKHQLSHQTIFARFYSLDIENEDILLHPDWEKIMLENIDEYPVSRLIDRFLED
jgi:A/G-specific adenine glycosylase